MSPNRPSDTEVDRLDPYAFMALVGKRVIHPGGRRSTAEMCQFARFEPGQQVVDVGCGVATTAVEVARRFRCHVTAVDIDPLMLGRAIANARAADVANVTVAKADIQALEFPDAAFDRVLNECINAVINIDSLSACLFHRKQHVFVMRHKCVRVDQIKVLVESFIYCFNYLCKDVIHTRMLSLQFPECKTHAGTRNIVTPHVYEPECGHHIRRVVSLTHKSPV